MIDQGPLFVHVGTPKTASTYLQHEIFPRLDSLRYIEKPRSKHFESLYGIKRFKDCFNRSPTLWRTLGDRLLPELAGIGGGQKAVAIPTLISDEGIITGLADINPASDHKSQDPFLLHVHFRKLQVCALRYGFTALKVILLFRRQDTRFASTYVQVSHRRPKASQADFERCVDWYLDSWDKFRVSDSLLDYALLYQQIGAAVGKQNVLMLPYEMLQHDFALFEKNLYGFFQQSGPPIRGRNASWGQSQWNVRALGSNTWRISPREVELPFPLKPLAKKLGKSKSLSLRLGRQHTVTLTDRLSKKILSGYTAKNRALGEMLGIDLARYGYY